MHRLRIRRIEDLGHGVAEVCADSFVDAALEGFHGGGARSLARSRANTGQCLCQAYARLALHWCFGILVLDQIRPQALRYVAFDSQHEASDLGLAESRTTDQVHGTRCFPTRERRSRVAYGTCSREEHVACRLVDPMTCFDADASVPRYVALNGDTHDVTSDSLDVPQDLSGRTRFNPTQVLDENACSSRVVCGLSPLRHFDDERVTIGWFGGELDPNVAGSPHLPVPLAKVASELGGCWRCGRVEHPQ